VLLIGVPQNLRAGRRDPERSGADAREPAAGRVGSEAGPAYCAQEATSTQTLGAVRPRNMANDNIPDGPVVGYYDT
jgi:hypothetical protein